MTSPVARDVKLEVTLPAEWLTGRVEVHQVRLLPGTPVGAHVHNGPVFGSIVTGSAVYQIDGGQPSTLVAGDVFYEPEGARIARFDATAEGVTFLAYYLLAAGERPEISFVEA